MAEEKKALAVPAQQQESISKRTLVRAFESHIVSKVQTEHGQEGDRQAPITLLRNEDGSPKKLVIVTTDSAFAKEVHEAINSKVGVAVRMHRAPTDSELEELSKELPMVTVPSALPPAAAKPVLALVPKPAAVAPSKPAEPTRSCMPAIDPSPAEGVYVRVKDERNKRIATSPVLLGVQDGVAWSREWNNENEGFAATVEIVRDGKVWRRYERKRSALSVV